MHSLPRPLRLLVASSAAVMLAGGAIVPASAQVSSASFASSAPSADTVFELRPHCIEGDLDNLFGGPVPDTDFMTKPTKGTCYQFEVRDPQTRQTDIMTAGDTLDMDLVVRNPTNAAISRVRAWLAYDPSVLDGVEIRTDSGFTMPDPDEEMFLPAEGYIKVGASTEPSLNAPTIVVARIIMKIRSGAAGQTIISFYNASTDPQSETAVIRKIDGQEQNLLNPPIGSLLVRFAEAAASSSAPVLSSAPASSAPPLPIPVISSSAQSSSAAISSASLQSSSAVPAESTVFSLLQVQNLRVTTEGTSAYLAWDALRSADLAGYNVYYGTVSGEYIQKRSVDKASTTLTVRDLIPGTRYYFAVRGATGNGNETEFSNEVAVTIGQPETSTAPLLKSTLPGGPKGTPPRTGGNIAGGTGVPSSLVLFLLASAVIGTTLALRRQFIAVSRP